jgi:hypothetical protein
MNCHRAQPLLFAERDRALSADERATLEPHLAGCPACQQLRRQLAEAAEAWRTTTAGTPVPDAQGEWQLVRLRLHPAETAVRRRPRSSWPFWAAWTGLPLAAAATLAVVLRSPPSAPTTAVAAVVPAHAEYVEPGDDDASTVVYVDQASGWLIVWAAAPTNGRPG